MYKIASVALSAALGVVGASQSRPADAHPYVSVGNDFPGGAVAEPLTYAPAYYAPYYLTQARYWSGGHAQLRPPQPGHRVANAFFDYVEKRGKSAERA
jgi:hypothetical protein